MKVLLYVNPEKDNKGEYFNLIGNLLKGFDIECLSLSDPFYKQDLSDINKSTFSAIISIGGDGTILGRTSDAIALDMPILGINAGKLGFLTEFELSEAETAIRLLKDGELVKDERAVAEIEFNGTVYYALNDAVILRSYEENGSMTVTVGVTIGNAALKNTIGDGIIVSTPTGSTGYSLSAGGAVLAPGINAFCLTPIAAHSLLSRSVVFSSEKTCKLTVKDGAVSSLYIDGKLVSKVNKNQTVTVSRAPKNVAFLRRKDFDFFGLLNKKLQDR